MYDLKKMPTRKCQWFKQKTLKYFLAKQGTVFVVKSFAPTNNLYYIYKEIIKVCQHGYNSPKFNSIRFYGGV